MAAKETYIESVGRRKTATARARITPAEKLSVVVNDRPLDQHFKTATLQKVVQDALATIGSAYTVSVKVIGGGVSAQAEAVRHAIARALVKEDPTRRKELKASGYLKRDPRAKERKKFGLKGARRAPQWSKR